MTNAPSLFDVDDESRPLADRLRPRILAEVVGQDLTAAAQKRVPLYDKSQEGQYNLISALHKSMRGSDPDAALYWLSRMLLRGEEPLFIAASGLSTTNQLCTTRRCTASSGRPSPAPVTSRLSKRLRSRRRSDTRRRQDRRAVGQSHGGADHKGISNPPYNPTTHAIKSRRPLPASHDRDLCPSAGAFRGFDLNEARVPSSEAHLQGRGGRPGDEHRTQLGLLPYLALALHIAEDPLRFIREFSIVEGLERPRALLRREGSIRELHLWMLVHELLLDALVDDDEADTALSGLVHASIASRSHGGT